MSIAEKLTTIAENVQKVYDVGKAAGGGLKYASGTVEFADNSNCVFYHNLGTVPRILLIWAEQTEETSGSCIGCIYSTITPFALCVVFEDRNGTTLSVVSASNSVPELTEEYAKVQHRSASYKFLTGVTYNWMVIE